MPGLLLLQGTKVVGALPVPRKKDEFDAQYIADWLEQEHDLHVELPEPEPEPEDPEGSYNPEDEGEEYPPGSDNWENEDELGDGYHPDDDADGENYGGEPGGYGETEYD